MAYQADDLQKQLAFLHCKNLPADVMRSLYTMKNRNSSFKRMNDLTFNQLLPFRADSQLSASTDSSANAHQIWGDQNENRDHWDLKDTKSLATPFSKIQRALQPNTYVKYRKAPRDWEDKKQYAHKNRQNNACLCAECCGSRGLPVYSCCEEPEPDEDPQISCDLNQIFEKIRKLAELRKHQSLMAGCYEPYLGVTEGLESPSVLSPPLEPPHTRCLVRVKPYKRHQMYQRMWKVQPAIGENFRFSLRQKVRQKMLIKEDVQLPHKMFVPNMYVVPTVKPRYELRWIVRKCNHDYRMPPCGVFRDVL